MADKCHRESETAEKHRNILGRQKAYHEKRKTIESEQHRAARLARYKACCENRKSSVYEEQRTARLADLCHNQHKVVF